MNSLQLVEIQYEPACRVMVSVDVCFDGKRRIHLIPDEAKVNTKFR